MTWNVEKIRTDFPILDQSIHGQPLVYLDNAATSQKPLSVLEAMDKYYVKDNANIHRGVHQLSERATLAYEAARKKAQHFVGAAQPEEIVFVRGTTEAINLVAHSFLEPRLGAGDEILLTRLEHHSNIVPWQLVAQRKGAKIVVVEMNQRGELLLDDLKKKLSARTKMASFGHVSNALGTINPIKEMIALCKEQDVPVMIDGAQAAPHLKIDVRDLNCDFYAFSAHKMYGPTGIGVLYGKFAHLEAMPPYQGGGEMITTVTFDKSEYNLVPHKFEAGTPDIAGVVGLGAAIDYLHGIDIERAAEHEHELLLYTNERLSAIEGLKLIGTAAQKTAVVSFVLEGIHPHDIGTILDQHGIAIRTGHHCAQPVMEFYKVAATARASFALYNTRAEVDRLAEGIEKVKEVFR